MKKKLLAWCDFVVPTGFANVAKNLLLDMHKDFDVSIVGINYHGDKRYDTDKYFVYSVTSGDLLGIGRLIKIAKEEQPELIFLFQDIFHISDIIGNLKKVSPKSKIVVYFPVDGRPFSKAWANVLRDADRSITYTDWAVDMIKEVLPDTKKIDVLYHGVDTSVFHPLPLAEISKYKEQYKWKDKFTVCAVNRFQPRKAIPIILRAWSMFAHGYTLCKKCNHKMPLHLSSCDLNGCSSEFLEKHPRDIQDIYLYLHMMTQEATMGPGRTNTLQHYMVSNGFSDEDYGKIIGVNGKNIYSGEVTEKDINLIYNCSDLNISTTLGEGCGLSLIESQAAGVPSIAPNNSAIPEMLNGTGTLINNSGLLWMPFDNSHSRPTVKADDVVDALDKYYAEWKKRGGKKIYDQECIKNIADNFMWEDKRDTLKRIFFEVLGDKK